eukprot:1105251-Prorocentrum_minimum.AAC.3
MLKVYDFDFADNGGACCTQARVVWVGFGTCPQGGVRDQSLNEYLQATEGEKKSYTSTRQSKSEDSSR